MNSYYTDILYPLQDRVLAVIDSLKTSFYLTGGTALSRCYLNHRYSDDLDFFVNSESNFLTLTDQILSELHKTFAVEVVMKSDTYVAIKIDKILKVDFVNDVAFRYGVVKQCPIFSQVDNLENILSNKLSAIISRDEAKDVVDIIEISKEIEVDWRKIFLDVQSKAVGISPVDVAKRLSEFPVELLGVIRWIEGTEPRVEVFKADIQLACDKMLRLSPLV